jgi:hypothetical protein
LIVINYSLLSSSSSSLSSSLCYQCHLQSNYRDLFHTYCHCHIHGSCHHFHHCYHHLYEFHHKVNQWARIWPSGQSGGLARDPGSILCRDGLYTLGCIPQRSESALAEILRYIKAIIYFIILFILFYFFFYVGLCCLFVRDNSTLCVVS